MARRPLEYRRVLLFAFVARLLQDKGMQALGATWSDCALDAHEAQCPGRITRISFPLNLTEYHCAFLAIFALLFTLLSRSLLRLRIQLKSVRESMECFSRVHLHRLSSGMMKIHSKLV